VCDVAILYNTLTAITTVGRQYRNERTGATVDGAYNECG